MKTTTINGINFQYKNETPYRNGKNSIYDLYSKPSYTKVSIFRDWENKLNSIYGLCGNSNTFSIYGDIIDENGVKHDVKITAWNNYILN